MAFSPEQLKPFTPPTGVKEIEYTQFGATVGTLRCSYNF
jgi:hypothetical protein